MLICGTWQPYAHETRARALGSHADVRVAAVGRIVQVVRAADVRLVEFGTQFVFSEATDVVWYVEE